MVCEKSRWWHRRTHTHGVLHRGVGRGGSQKPALEMMGWCSAQWLWVGGEGVHGGTIHTQGLPGSPNLACPSVRSISFGKKMF